MSRPAGVDSLAVLACDQLNQGANKQNVVAWLSQYNPYVANDTFLRKAALYYCPEHNNKLAGWQGPWSGYSFHLSMVAGFHPLTVPIKASGSGRRYRDAKAALPPADKPSAITESARHSVLGHEYCFAITVIPFCIGGQYE